MNPIQFSQLIYLGVGLLLAVVSFPLIQRWIKPNLFYGFRVPKAYKTDEIWYEINAYSGKRFFVAGLVIALVGVLLPLVPDVGLELYVLLVPLVIAVALGAASFKAFSI